MKLDPAEIVEFECPCCHEKLILRADYANKDIAYWYAKSQASKITHYDEIPAVVHTVPCEVQNE